LLNPDDVTPRQDQSTGELAYWYRNVKLPQEELFHPRAWRLAGLDVGLSPIQQHAVLINRDDAIQRFSLGYFQDAPHPASVLTSDQAINAEQARTIKERLLAAITGREPLVLGAGLKFNPLSVSPEESQFLATQKYGAAEIARIFGVPAQKIAGADVGNGMNYASVEMSGIDLLTYTIQWWLTNLEANFAPLFPGQQHVRFDPSVLLRTDFETTIKSTAIGIASKQMTPDEARAKRDEPPLTDEQKQILSLIPMDVSPTGMPKALPIAAPEQEAEVTGDNA
jgi:HK97 family phage portal protein